jgi:energy-coupling factor transporter ATP-binding protein EcfA2
MLSVVKLKAVGPLPETILPELGRVNVICGKNNSGKSTVLAALAAADRRSMGGAFDEVQIGRVIESSIGNSPFGRGSGRDVERSIYADWMSKYLRTRKYWFVDDRNAIAADTEKLVDGNAYLGRHAFNHYMFADQVSGTVGTFPSHILIPPKRRLQLSAQISLNDEVKPMGDGLLNYLFYSKNQPRQSSDGKAYDVLSRSFLDISSGFRFDVFAEKGNTIVLSFARAGNNWIPAADCGLGLQDLLILLYWVIVAKEELVLVEEPESHMHPDMQRRLLTFIRDNTQKQLFVTTHSNVFLNNALVDRVFFTTFSDGMIRVDDATSRASILDDLGYAVTDNLVSDLVILVEGPSDVPVVEEFLKKYGLLARFEVRIWPLGGDVMDQLDLSVFAERYKLIALIDQDPESAAIRRRFEAKCAEVGIPVHRLERYSIENYFTVDALRSVFGKQLPDTLTELAPDTKVSKQTGFDVKKKNRAIARAMSLEDIAGTDLARFFDQVIELLQRESTDV